MDGDILQCKFCEEKFNTSKRIPHMLIKCGHSICSKCITRYHQKNIEISCIRCDGEQVYQPAYPIEKSFPINMALVQMLENEGENDENSSIIDDSQSENKSEDECEEEA